MEHVRFGTMQVETRDDRHFFRIQVLPGTFPVGDLKVELYASVLETGDPVVETIKACDQCKAPNGAVTYSGQVTAVRGSSDYTPRIMPYHPAASLPVEAGQILWQC